MNLLPGRNKQMFYFLITGLSAKVKKRLFSKAIFGVKYLSNIRLQNKPPIKTGPSHLTFFEILLLRSQYFYITQVSPSSGTFTLLNPCSFKVSANVNETSSSP